MTRSFGLTLEDLEESLAEIIPAGFEIKVIKGKVVIATNLVENSYGELVVVEPQDDEDEEDEDLDSVDEDYLDEDMDLQDE